MPFAELKELENLVVQSRKGNPENRKLRKPMRDGCRKFGMEKEKRPDTTPASLNTILNLFVGVTTPNAEILTEPDFSACHQCWGQPLPGRGQCEPHRPLGQKLKSANGGFGWQ